MAFKLELILASAILITFFIFNLYKNGDSTIKRGKIVDKKDMEINRFIAYDINQTQIENIIKAKQAIKKGNSWYLTDANISTNDIKTLLSEIAIYQNDTFLFKDNVVAVKKDGTIYKSNEAIYNMKNSKFHTNSAFIIIKDGNIVKGSSLYYDKKDKITKAKDINSTIKLKTK